MRVALMLDMEGASQIDDIREPFPMYPAYWDAGRAKLTDDVVAAARGLLRGGATDVLVIDHHGAGDGDWPNVIAERFPDRVSLVDGWGMRGMRDHVDALFQVGVHARGGSPSFLSHTVLPGLRLRLDGELLSESDWWAFTGNVPLLGMVGSEALGADRRFLSDVPFLTVQRTVDRSHALPVMGPEETAESIEAFAVTAVRAANERRVTTPSGPIELWASLQNGEDAAPAMESVGWVRRSRTEFVLAAEAWRDDAETIDEGIDAAADAAWKPYTFWFDSLDASSRDTALAYPPEQLARDDELLVSWSADAPPLWFSPDDADRALEGFARD